MMGSGTAALISRLTLKPILWREGWVFYVRWLVLQPSFRMKGGRIMRRRMPKKISVLEFRCLSAVRFFERCAACPRFGDGCRDLELGKKILRGQKKIAYGVKAEIAQNTQAGEDTIHVNAFNCLVPLYYIERSRIRCPHDGRCRDEGLLLVLLDGKKVLDYSHKKVIELPLRRRRHEAAKKAA
jgi:hypothetical protein